jgi:plastocyanin
VRVLAGLAILLGSAGCGSTSRSVKPAPRVITVQVDARGRGYAASFAAFFPRRVAAHPGDTVRFQSVFTGEPHTVTLGRMVDDALAASDRARPGTDPRSIPELQALPRFFRPGTELVQPAAAPCFIERGAPPASACPPRRQPAFDVNESYFNSGWLRDKSVFSVKLADDLRPGVYRFICLTHKPIMAGAIRVVDAGTPLPSAAAIRREGDAERARLQARLDAAVAAERRATSSPLSGVVPGPSLPDAIANDFFPERLTVRTGQSVTWTVEGPHTISFNAPKDATPAFRRNRDGTVRYNARTITPVHSPPWKPGARELDAGSFDGTEYLNSGVIESFEPYTTFKVRFTRRGSYEFVCLLHEDMEGRVTVR